MDGPLVIETLDSLREGIQILSKDWRYLYVNDAVERQGRKGRDELLGKTMHECYPGIEKTPLFSTLERCMRERRHESMETDFVFEDGSHAAFELRIHPCNAGLVLISLDMTERKGIEKRLHEAYRQALRDLVTPVIRVHHGVLLVPLIGVMDRQRVDQMTENLLDRVAAEHAHAVILDVAGLPELDTSVAHDLLQTTAMLRLLGAGVILTGVKAAAAKTVVQLGVDLSAMQTTTELAEGIELAMAIVRKKTRGR